MKRLPLVLAAIAVILPLAIRPVPAQAQGPWPTETLGGQDGVYISRGWTTGYSSRPLESKPPARPAAALPYTVQVPAVVAGPAPRETRALWVTRWDFATAADVRAIVDKAAYAHLNTILFQVRGQADALYHSSLEPWWAQYGRPLGQDPGWDPLGEVITRAHAAGLEVQAWINAYPAWLGATPPPTQTVPLPMFYDLSARYEGQWVQWDAAGPMPLRDQRYLCANPAHPAVVQHIVDVCKDILARYPVDGLHFDYIRYDGPQYSQDPVSRDAYAQAAAASPGLTYADWQRAQVTALLERVRQEALPLRPGARLTASAWPVYQNRWGWPASQGYNDYYQDSHAWARDGVVSAIMPMIYGTAGTPVHDSRDWFSTLTADHVAGAQPGGAIIGIEGDYDSFAEIAWRIETARAAGARGQALFSYRLFDERHYWQALRDGPYQRIAVPAY